MSLKRPRVLKGVYGVFKRAGVPSVFERRGRDSENASFDSATALHFWSVKQLNKIA